MNTTTENRYSNVTPVFLGVLGFLVYYGLFASFDRTRGFVNEGPLQLVGTMWKLGIFSATMWRVGEAARTSRKLYLSLGGAFAIGGSALLLAIEIFSPNETPASAQAALRFLVEGIEAVGEAFICAGLVAHVREETLGNDWRYFRVTTALRVGQNTGMVLTLFLGTRLELWKHYAEQYATVLLGMRVCVALLLLRMIRGSALANLPRVKREKKAVTLDRLVLDVTMGASAYALFYLVAIGPSTLVQGYDKCQAIALNGAFALIAMVVIYVLANNADKQLPAKFALLKIESIAVIGGVVVIAGWMISLWYRTPSSLLIGAGLLGLFTTSTYVLSELSSGLYGNPKNQAAQIVSYFGLSRLGPIVALVTILLTQAAHSAVPLSTAAVLGCAGIVLGVVQKWRIESKGGRREYV
jgi:hypothetical protein